MRRILCVLLTLCLLCSLLPAAGAEESPVLALTYIPAYGENSAFIGVVFRENGGSFDPADYRISLYLQVTPGDTYWVKPTSAMPYAEVGTDGTFSIRYVSGGYDDVAQVLHIMLIPASFTPDASFQKTRDVALDYVTVTRTPEGEITVSPEREAPAVQHEHCTPSGLKASAEKLAIDVGFYTDGSHAGGPLSEEQIRTHLCAVSAFADTVRFYGASGPLYPAYRIANELGLTVVGTAWLEGADPAEDKAELDALIEHCDNGLVRVACVGNETLLSGKLTEEKLIESIDYVRARLTDKTIPVTTSDSVDILLERPALREACDILMPNCYPFWGGSSIETAASGFAASLSALKAAAAGKEIVVSETGWPTDGTAKGSAIPNEENARAYFEKILDWSVSTGTPLLWFASADEPWKAAAEGLVGSHFGLLTSDLEVKDCFAKTTFFQNVGPVGHKFDGPRCTVCGAVNPDWVSVFEDVSASAYYAAAVDWAVKREITNGIDATHFGPNRVCTRAQVVTFLWRASGAESDPLIAPQNPFTDVDGSAYYSNAVLWAVANGVTTGTAKDSFSPNAGCTRAQVVTFLWRASGAGSNPPIAPQNPFTDVDSSAYYYDAVLWAVEKGVTTGTSADRFSPGATCTRAQIVTFLYRLLK